MNLTDFAFHYKKWQGILLTKQAFHLIVLCVILKYLFEFQKQNNNEI